MTVTINTVRPGAAGKDHPFTICVVANPALEAPWNSGNYIADPIIGQSAAFQSAASYIEAALFGLMPAQQEKLLADPAIEPNVRFVTIYDDGLPVNAANCLVSQDTMSDTLIARRSFFVAWLVQYQLEADVIFAVSSSCTHVRASAYFTSDDDNRQGVPFLLDSQTLYHRLYYRTPGTVAIHKTASSVTALHEFSHAISSYSNGRILDLYTDSPAGLNNKLRRPIPQDFGTYNLAKNPPTTYPSDLTRDGLGYPPGWQSYHSELADPACPALMDDYWQSAKGPDACRHDSLTAQFIRDRVLAKMTRP